MKPTVSIFFPMLNEEANIHASVAAAQRVLGEAAREHEIIIVDDGSTDRTGAIADELSAADSRVRVVHHGQNRGLGAGIRSGFEASRYEVVVYTDGDLPCDLGYLSEALPLLGANDLVVGYRTTKRENLLRALYSACYNFLIHSLFKVRVRDINFAFKVFRGDVARSLDLRCEGSFIDAEVLAECVRTGHGRIAEIPVVYTPRVAGVSTLARPRVIIGIFREMYRYRRRPKRAVYQGE